MQKSGAKKQNKNKWKKEIKNIMLAKKRLKSPFFFRSTRNKIYSTKGQETVDPKSNM